MATITVTPIKTFTSGETVTPAKLNELSQPTVALTAGTIVNADIAAGAAIAASKLSTVAQQSLVPAGAVMLFAMNSAPAGWLAANGDPVSRTDYAALFSAIGTTHGVGNGSTTFNLPDLRGIFVRGSGSQTISGTTYAGTFAQKLRDQMQRITGRITNAPGAQGFRGGSNSINEGALEISEFSGRRYSGNESANFARIIDFDSAKSPDARVSSTTDGETRPANIALLYCIKF